MSATPRVVGDGDLLRSFSPQTPTDLVGEFSAASPAAVEHAVAAARVAQRAWWGVGAAERAGALSAAAGALRAQQERAATTIVREVGKPITEAIGEVARAISILDYYSQACFAAIGDLYPPSIDGLLLSQRRPHGVAGLLTPWNFPLAIPLWKAAPALASGNAVVLKPSPDGPCCAELIRGILAAELPADVFTVVHGGADTGRALVRVADIISFTGSDRVGRAVAAQAGNRAVPAQCEMGGQNAAIVFEHAEPARTAAMVAGAAMGYAGQKCTATRRVIVIGDNDEFVDALTRAVAGLAVGAPEESATIVGPMISERARANVIDAIDLARSAGGTVLTGGSAAPGEGWYVAPTLIEGLRPAHPLAQQETFGPLTTIHRARDADEAVRLANDVRFGLVTSLHGRDLDQLVRAAAAIDTGLIKINAPTTGVDFYAPFGGEKDSSYGAREQGLAALAFYSTTRTMTICPHAG